MTENHPQHDLIVAMQAIGITVTAVETAKPGEQPPITWRTFPSNRLAEKVFLFLEDAREADDRFENLKASQLQELIRQACDAGPQENLEWWQQWRQRLLRFRVSIPDNFSYLVFGTDKYRVISGKGWGPVFSKPTENDGWPVPERKENDGWPVSKQNENEDE